MKATSILTIGCAAIALSVTSCTNFGSPNTYNMNEIGGVQETYYGTVTSVETVKIQANNANAGTGVGAVAGCYVLDGKMQRNAQMRVLRDNIVIYDGAIASLQRFKDSVKEVTSGYECGITLEKFSDIKPGDIFECFEMQEIER